MAPCLSVSRSPLSSDAAISTLLPVVYRVHWLRAKAKFDRAQEQLVLLLHEMNWTLAYFKHQSDRWLTRKTAAEEANMVGHACYAAKQRCLWSGLHNAAEVVFSPLKT